MPSGHPPRGPFPFLVRGRDGGVLPRVAPEDRSPTAQAARRAGAAEGRGDVGMCADRGRARKRFQRYQTGARVGISWGTRAAARGAGRPGAAGRWAATDNTARAQVLWAPQNSTPTRREAGTSPYKHGRLVFGPSLGGQPPHAAIWQRRRPGSRAGGAAAPSGSRRALRAGGGSDRGRRGRGRSAGAAGGPRAQQGGGGGVVIAYIGVGMCLPFAVHARPCALRPLQRVLLGLGAC
ncbi:MAG: hypothetical protein J3K34DRAFT_421003 [Monoraphidium minutum]|nr:MAG: hypothetical protein J3K34DRAFT_421003 [Monoraphidium minutum]